MDALLKAIVSKVCGGF